MRRYFGMVSVVVALAAGIILSGHNPALWLLLAGLAWIFAFGLWGALWPNPLWALVTTVVLGTVALFVWHQTFPVTAGVLVVVTAAIATISSRLARIRQPSGLRWYDGLWAAVLFVLASIVVSITQIGTKQPLGQNLPVLVSVYLLTPAIEVGIIYLVLRHSHILKEFLRRNYRGASMAHVVTGIAVGIGLTVLMGIAVSLEQKIAHIRVQSNNPFLYARGLNPHTVLAAILVGLAVVVAAPITEEALFRGILFGGFLTRVPYPVATLGAALLFGAAHMDLTLLIPLTLAGLVLNAVYRRNQSLVPSTVAHATFNGLSVILAVFVH
ncbi:MAG: hypothetical protein C7B46_00795 [Sulfobacillus benefaciens]|uniref:CAAX prenyl protease 2/Lysostaphin resistance protein A-like domain-containing protein n=1 Tax=Sulfobacillus benefaciens TaxID=453960 RepID=A0A2T2XM50_9FIRM|nr:MAG: hypothetical protein C7B46_00795 [Sulfobacillus benefaciens]